MAKDRLTRSGSEGTKSNPQGKPETRIKVRLVSLDEFLSHMAPAALDESDIMLDPWVELPPPSVGIIVVAQPGELPPPDIPEIPQDREDS